MVRGLVRAQLRTSLILAAVSLFVLAGLPLLFRLVPALGELAVFGVPISWLILGVLPYPFILLIGYISTRSAERHEREFVDMVDR